ncbi:MAG: hypothetical protein MAG551_01067 [Candidatus Scalindua arabica]|uniref:Uncharacterized protein n=1 Tax=Candidatus Scalindua arabica TaxID=1127984 RepID=A0A942A3T0_9BACT|nr:hypothetical protein [Candidatus Scalindua arabica]
MIICNISLTRHTFDRMSNVIMPLKIIEDTMSNVIMPLKIIEDTMPKA